MRRAHDRTMRAFGHCFPNLGLFYSSTEGMEVQLHDSFTHPGVVVNRNATCKAAASGTQDQVPKPAQSSTTSTLLGRPIRGEASLPEEPLLGIWLARSRAPGSSYLCTPDLPSARSARLPVSTRGGCLGHLPASCHRWCLAGLPAEPRKRVFHLLHHKKCSGFTNLDGS